MIRSVARALAVVALFAAATAIVTWPQPRVLGSRAVPHQDVYFNMWRLEWFAHQIARDPTELFDANIFYPEPKTLALSDAMIVEGAVAAPLIWAGVRPLLVQNLLLFGAMALSGAAMFVLAWSLTGSRGAGVIGGLVFALAPYRFEHVMHMELQWAMWSPLALLAAARAMDTGAWRWGLAAGAFIALQMLSSIYYGVFLATLLAVIAVLDLVTTRPRTRALGVLLGGAALAAVVCGLYAVPYLHARAANGERSTEEVQMFSALPSNYTVATPDNWLYGRMNASRGRPERRLFPGILPVLLSIVGLLLRPVGRRQIIFLFALVLAFDMSLGPHGYVYPLLYAHLPAYRALRAAARLGIFVLLFLGVLAGYGYAALAYGRGAIARAILLCVLAAGLLAEYRVHLTLSGEYPNAAPPVYRFLASQPKGVVAEIPFPGAASLPGPDPYYSYASTFHWFPLVNGYSGVYPASYLRRLDRMHGFPDPSSVLQMRRDDVEYVIVHTAAVAQGVLDEVRASTSFIELGEYPDADGRGTAVVFRMH